MRLIGRFHFAICAARAVWIFFVCHVRVLFFAFSISGPSVFAPNFLSRLNDIWLNGKKRGDRTEDGQKSNTEHPGTPRNTNWRALRPRIHPLLSVFPFSLLVPPKSSIRPILKVSAVSEHSVLLGGQSMGSTSQRHTTETRGAPICGHPALKST